MTLRPLAFVLLLACAAPAQFIYALNSHGKLTLNGTVLDALPDKLEDQGLQFTYKQWNQLAVHGADRYALRMDGLLYRNGTKLLQLSEATLLEGGYTFHYSWWNLVVTDNGVHMLRADGERAVDGKVAVHYPMNSSLFVGLVIESEGSVDTAFALRQDGKLFRGNSTAIAATFTGLMSSPQDPPDGTVPYTYWSDVALDTLNQQLLALRTDGQVFRLPLSSLPIAGSEGGVPPTAELLVQLPFSEEAKQHQADLYHRLAVANGEWRVLRLNGAVFGPASLVAPLVDYEGDGNSPAYHNDLAWNGTQQWALRSDGKVYADLEATTPLFTLPAGFSWGHSLAIGTQPPDLSHFKNQPPKAATYTLKVLEGQAVSVPVLVSDIEKLSDDLVVTENPSKPLPAGATFLQVDDGLGHLTRSIEWDGSQPVGTYKCPLLVSDGKHKPVKFIEKIKVVALDDDPDNKNKPPKPLKPKAVQALVSHEVRIPVFGFDLDGDALSFSVDTDKEPWKTLGASFDTDTNEFVWTPSLGDIGTFHPKISLTDGTKTVSFTLTVKVLHPLIFE